MSNPNNAEIKIVNRNPDGRGRGRVGDRVVLVAQTVPGDTVVVNIDKQTRNTVQGRVKQLVEPSPDRVESYCSHQFVCTGCVLLGTSAEDEMAYKEERVVGYLEKSSTACEMESPVKVERSGEALDYRYFAKQVFALEKGRPILGSYIAATHEVADNSGCPVLAGCVRDAVEVVIDEVCNRGMRIHWREEKGLRYLTVRGSHSTQETLLVLVSSKLLEGVWLEELEDMANALMSRVKGACGVVAIENDDAGNVILRGDAKLLAGRDFVEDEICGFKHEIGAQSFFQINPLSAELMFERALSYAGEGEICLELFSGVGAMTLPLTKTFKKVIAVELSEEATLALSRSMSQAEPDSIRIETGDAFELGPKLLTETGCKVLVADPPRRGLGEDLIAAIANSQVERLVLLSCQPAVLQTDLPILEKAGFKLQELSVVDQFPGTVHVEAVTLLVRNFD